MRVSFWLLDINPKVDGDKIELQLWGITPCGERVLVVDRNFTAYFYATVKQGFDASKLAEDIINAYPAAIVKAEVVSRRFFGKPVDTIKVYCRVATETGKVAKKLHSLKGVDDCLEDDIRAAMRYLIDNDVVPCSWHEVEADQEENTGIHVAKVYAAKTPPIPLDLATVPQLRVLAFSMIYYSHEGSPKADRNPIIILSTSSNNGEQHEFSVKDDLNDKSVIEDFTKYVRQFDPDIIVSFGANTLDWNYLRDRSHKFGLPLTFGRAGLEPHTSVYGHVSTTGVVNVDLADFIDMFPEVKVQTLWNFVDHLGLVGEDERPIEDVLFADYWDDPNRRGELLRFGLYSARKIRDAAGLLLDFAMQLSNLTSLPLDQVMTAATGFRVEWFLIKRAQKIGELVPRRIEQTYLPYAGGLVLSPQPGLHENIAILDFKSMYPNIMITYNLSPDTYLASNEAIPEGGFYEAPEVHYRFRKSPPGFYKEALTYLINNRAAIRQKMKALDSKTVEFRVLDARQKVVKIITNAAYGYAGWVGARWYIKPVAEAASAWGRHIILSASQMAEKAGINVIYGDTDSLFINYDPTKAPQLQEQIKQELKLDVELGEVYQRILFTEAKKRYAGLRQDGSLDIVGLEVIRGDWAQVAKTVQEHVLELILTGQSPKKAVAYVHSVIVDLKHKRVPLRDLVIWKTLTKAPEDYAVNAPHVEAAKILKAKGWRLTSGDKVGYVILSGKGPLYSRVKPYVFARYTEVDVTYYITNQVLPAAVRILSMFGVSEEDLMEESVQTQEIRSLMDYV